MNFAFTLNDGFRLRSPLPILNELRTAPITPSSRRRLVVIFITPPKLSALYSTPACGTISSLLTSSALIARSICSSCSSLITCSRSLIYTLVPFFPFIEIELSLDTHTPGAFFSSSSQFLPLVIGWSSTCITKRSASRRMSCPVTVTPSSNVAEVFIFTSPIFMLLVTLSLRSTVSMPTNENFTTRSPSPTLMANWPFSSVTVPPCCSLCPRATTVAHSTGLFSSSTTVPVTSYLVAVAPSTVIIAIRAAINFAFIVIFSF